MVTTSIGRQAESRVADHLKTRGFEIIDRNWRTKVCEIDIVARKNDVIYFVEVKYRSAKAQGDGLEYIGPKKLNRLIFAGTIWTQKHGWDGDYRLMAASVDDSSRVELVEI